jgi:hypothetical protein
VANTICRSISITVVRSSFCFKKYLFSVYLRSLVLLLRFVCCDPSIYQILLTCHLRQFPQSTLSSPANTPAYRQTMAEQYVTSLKVNNVDVKRAKFVTNYSPLLHVFTHLKLTMHVYKFRVDMDHVENFNLVCAGAPPRKWVDAASMDTETLSTGMRKCWAVSKPIPPTITSGEVEYENYDGLASTICEVTSPSDYGNSDR